MCHDAFTVSLSDKLQANLYFERKELHSLVFHQFVPPLWAVKVPLRLHFKHKEQSIALLPVQSSKACC